MQRLPGIGIRLFCLQICLLALLGPGARPAASAPPPDWEIRLSERLLVNPSGSQKWPLPGDFVSGNWTRDNLGQLWLVGRNSQGLPAWWRLRSRAWEAVDPRPALQAFAQILNLIGYAPDRIPKALDDFSAMGMDYVLSFMPNNEPLLLPFIPIAKNIGDYHYVDRQYVFELLTLKAGFAIRDPSRLDAPYFLFDQRAQLRQAVALPMGSRLIHEDSKGWLWAADGQDLYRCRRDGSCSRFPVSGQFLLEDERQGLWIGYFTRTDARQYILVNVQDGKLRWTRLDQIYGDIANLSHSGPRKLILEFYTQDLFLLDLARNSYQRVNFRSIFSDSLYGGKGIVTSSYEIKNGMVGIDVYIFDNGTCNCEVGDSYASVALRDLDVHKLNFETGPLPQ